MTEISVLASANFIPSVFHHEQSLCRHPKEFQTQLPSHGKRQDGLRSGPAQPSRPHVEDPWQSMNLLSEYNQTASVMSMSRKPVLIDLQDARSDSVLFSFGISEQCIKHEETLKFLDSGSNLAEGGLDFPLLSGQLDLHTVAMDKCAQPHFPLDCETCLYESGMDNSRYLMQLERQFAAPKPLLDFVGSRSNITVHPDGRVLFTGSGSELKDILSIVAEFNPSRRWTNGTKQAMIVPYFSWSGGRRVRAGTRVPSKKMHSQTATPLKSPEKTKLKPQKKKKNQKAGNDRDLYRKNYFHACECLLSAVLDKRGGTSMHSLTKSAPEINAFLVQFSAGIAGTGLAVLFSVVFKMGSPKRLFSGTKLMTTGVGLGLFWLSCAVNGLRDTITHITKNSSKLKLKEEEMVTEVEKSVNVVLFRAAALMAVAVLRLV